MLRFRYFSEGFQAIEHFGNYISELSGKLAVIRQVQEDEKSDLIEVRNSLKNSPGLEKMVSFTLFFTFLRATEKYCDTIDFIRL